MHTNLIPNDRPNTALPAPIIGFKNEIFFGINTELAEQIEFASNARLDYFADMSHEIRTPISAIIGLGRILLSSKLDDKQRQCMTVMQSSAEALLAMINRTLEISKIESGRADLQNAPFDMAALLAEIVSLMSVKAREKNIGLSLHYETGATKRFFSDSGRIRQIVMNLVGNAVKFTDTGEVAISFAMIGRDASISVADTGIGIAADKIGIIFDRFTQADASNCRKHDSTGLGLSISKILAENMGGKIAVESVEGKGSTFSLHLPLPAAANEGGNEPHYEENVIYLEAAANAKDRPLMPQTQ